MSLLTTSTQHALQGRYVLKRMGGEHVYGLEYVFDHPDRLTRTLQQQVKVSFTPSLYEHLSVSELLEELLLYQAQQQCGEAQGPRETQETAAVTAEMKLAALQYKLAQGERVPPSIRFSRRTVPNPQQLPRPLCKAVQRQENARGRRPARSEALVQAAAKPESPAFSLRVPLAITTALMLTGLAGIVLSEFVRMPLWALMVAVAMWLTAGLIGEIVAMVKVLWFTPSEQRSEAGKRLLYMTVPLFLLPLSATLGVRYLHHPLLFLTGVTLLALAFAWSAEVVSSRKVQAALRGRAAFPPADTAPQPRPALPETTHAPAVTRLHTALESELQATLQRAERSGDARWIYDARTALELAKETTYLFAERENPPVDELEAEYAKLRQLSRRQAVDTSEERWKQQQRYLSAKLEEAAPEDLKL